MSVRNIFTLAISLGLLLFLVPLLPARSQVTNPHGSNTDDDIIWTNWGAEQYALADDGQSIWIAADGGILQWDKASGATRRYSAIDGLPHRNLFVVAVDPAGNRWFGGDAGLSRLDSGGIWTHFNTKNSALTHDFVDGIAVGAGGALWLSHGLSDGPVTRWQPDGAMQSFSNRRTAVAQSYTQVKETVNANNLWAVSGDEVWVGYWVYNGATWEDRRPPDSFASHEIVRSGNNGYTYVLDWSYEGRVYRWDGTDWSVYNFSSGFNSNLNVLTVGPDNSAWVAWQIWESPYSGPITGISRLPDEPGYVDVDVYLGISDPVSALLATIDGLWGIGPAWIMEPGFALTGVPDVPAGSVERAILTTGNTLFVQSRSAIQTMDDRTTTVLDDDAWAFSTTILPLTVLERLPDNGLWATGSESTRAGPFYRNLRYHNGSWFEHGPAGSVNDIFAQTPRDTWFTYDIVNSANGGRGVSHLDDGGTPRNFSDDVWTTFPTDWEGRSQAVAVDSLSHLWFGDDTGLYRHDGSGWQLVYAHPPGSHTTCDIVPADDDTIFVERSEHCNSAYSGTPPAVLVIRPGGAQELRDRATLIREEFGRVSTAAHRNRLWAVAPDGAVWYVDYPNPRLARYDGSQLTTYDLPFSPGHLPPQPLTIDANNHVWLAAGGQLWRMSPRVGFHVDDQVWLLAPGATAQRTLTLHSFGGYSGPVTLALANLPPGITVAFETNPLLAGETTQLTLTVAPTVAPGAYYTTLIATDGDLTRTAVNTIFIAPTVHDLYAPLVAHP